MKELNRLIFKIPNRYGDTGYMWLIQEREDKWSLVSLGQEYELYREIGKRCAAAEAGMLLLPPLGRVSIEEYLEICEQAISLAKETEQLYDFLEIDVTFRLKDFDVYRQKRLKEMMDVIPFTEVSPDVFHGVNPDPSSFSIGGLGAEHIQVRYIGPVLKQELLKEKQQTLF